MKNQMVLASLNFLVDVFTLDNSKMDSQMEKATVFTQMVKLTMEALLMAKKMEMVKRPFQVAMLVKHYGIKVLG